jgi:hypothetical protein
VLAAPQIHLTFVGRCPGASVPEIDETLLPEVLLARLLDRGLVPEDQPYHYDGRLPPERARHASLPGGVPEPRWLAATAGATLREAAPATLSVVAANDAEQPAVIDLGVACGCVCARDRFSVARLEPARAEVPVVAGPRVELGAATVSGFLAPSLPAPPPAPVLRDAPGPEGAAWVEVATPPLPGPTVEPWLSVSSPQAPVPRSEDHVTDRALVAPSPAHRLTTPTSTDVVAPPVSDETGEPRGRGLSGGSGNLGSSQMRFRSPTSVQISPPLRDMMAYLDREDRAARRRRLRRTIALTLLGVLAVGVPLAARWVKLAEPDSERVAAPVRRS